jgi:hypothetical protein
MLWWLGRFMVVGAGVLAIIAARAESGGPLVPRVAVSLVAAAMAAAALRGALALRP